MPAPRTRQRARLSALVTAALAVGGFQTFLAPAPAAEAASTGLVIKEVYGAGGNAGAVYNADFVELYNPQSTPVSMNGLFVQYRSNGNGVGGTQALPDRTLPPGEHFLVQMSAAGSTGASLPQPNLVASPSINMAAAGGQIILGTATSYGTGNLVGAPGVVDAFGTSGASSYEAAPAPAVATASQSLNRSATGGDTDNNASDFSLGAPTPTPAYSFINPGVVRVVVGQPANVSLSAVGGTAPYTWQISGLPAGLSGSSTGVITGTPTTVGVSTVQATVTDSSNPAKTDSGTFTLRVNPAAGATNTIAEIQGTGDETPFYGQSVKTSGVVTAAYPTGGLNGFYIQKPGADTANASDAVFVFGGNGFSGYPAVGSSVEVTGTATEFNGLTEITGPTVTPIADLGAVTPKTQVPGTNCGVGACKSASALDVDREAVEGELFQPTAPWTVTDVYDGGPYYSNGSNGSNEVGEIGLAADRTTALVAPTEVVDAQNVTARAARTAYNDAHRIILDDGSSVNYSSTTDQPLPWMTKTYVPRVGAAVTFPKPVVFSWGFGAWRVLPQSRVVGAPTADQPQIAQTRAQNLAPAAVPGDVKLATFNVLNFFPTTGEEFAATAGNTCTYYNDRAGDPVTVNTCNPNGPRGAANAANLQRQRDKIVSAINTADADIVSLEELENSVKFGKSRDFAIGELVNALNAATPNKWDYAPSPAVLPPTSQQDVIRTGFIYQPARIDLVGDSVVLSDQSDDATNQPFADAREPLAQAFKKVGQPNDKAFAVIVNHFKSKGSGTPDPDGQGNANDRRVLQAQTLVTFADSFKSLRSVDKVFLVGDFNAYSKEDPIQVLEAAGYTNLESTTDPSEKSYNFDGQIGSLDHVLANDAADQAVRGVDIWPINSYESVYYEYSRYNYNATDLYDAGPFRSSDHNPEIVGFSTSEPATRDIQILGTNDFHGRLQNDTSAATAGAAVLAGAVKKLRGQNPDTVFAAAGDLIGASTFESFIAKDKPAIDALNSAGLEVSAAGNHEFDQGYDDLVNRVMKPASADNPYGGAGWQYIADNVRFKSNNRHALAPTWTKMFGNVKVGFVGAVTEHLPELVSPSGISQIKVTDIVAETNDAADELKRNGADIVVLLVHEGAAGTDCTTMDDDPTSDFGSIIAGVDENVDAIISGHTHLAYDCSFTVPEWVAQNRAVKERPVVSAGQYGMALNKLVFTVDTSTGAVTAKSQALLPLKVGTSGSAFSYPVDGPTQDIVDAAVADAAVLGAKPLGQVSGGFYRAKLADQSTENRGAESSLGNLVAEVQRWATSTPEAGAAQIAFMNPGGLRADMTGTGTGAFPRTLTYQQAATVQPFANTLVNMDLTGAQIKTVLEQQWQATTAARPFLKLGISKGFTYTATPPPANAPAGTKGTVTGMWLDGVPIGMSSVYSVTVNSFLASGGDGFAELANGAGKQDTGKTDLQAMVDYMAQFGSGSNAVAPDYRQNGVNVTFPAGAPASYAAGDHVRMEISGWSMTNTADLKDDEVTIKLGDTALGSVPLTNTPQAALPGFDVTGTASVDVVLPQGLSSGTTTLTLVGAKTGTSVPVQVVTVGSTTPPPPAAQAAKITVDGPTRAKIGERVKVRVSVAGVNGARADGSVRVVLKGGVVTTVDLVNGSATLNLGKFGKPGARTFEVQYLGSAAVEQGSTTVKVKIKNKRKHKK
jgi:predicted extracellular nuclease/2',3'-cyclic-nucleotide 2'-phosphodiesterase (5'-nucleotidase family)